jgi:hypothetical protein
VADDMCVSLVTVGLQYTRQANCSLCCGANGSGETPNLVHRTTQALHRQNYRFSSLQETGWKKSRTVKNLSFSKTFTNFFFLKRKIGTISYKFDTLFSGYLFSKERGET